MPVPAPTVRVLSDLHYADPASSLQNLRSLEPLLAGVDHLILNGDTLDTQVQPGAESLVAEIKAFFPSYVSRADFIAGNHDPDISPLDEVLLGENRIWVTHGHVLYDDIAPWSRLVPEIRRRFRLHGGELAPSELQKLEVRYRLFRQICLKLPSEQDLSQRGQWARIRRFARILFPPNHLFIIIEVWRGLPDLARRIAQAQRPQARVILTGHTHRPGVWKRGDGQVVINTGSFCPPGRGQLVDLVENRVIVRQIKRINGEFHPGVSRAEFTLAPLAVSAVGAIS